MPLRDQSTKHVDKHPENQDQKQAATRGKKGIQTTTFIEFLSRNQKKCNHYIQPMEKLRIFATHKVKKIGNVDSDL